MKLTRELVQATATQWAEAVNAHDVERIATMYADDAVLWGTFASSRRTEKSCLREYFSRLCSREALETEYIEQHVRIDGDHAFNSGSYLFSWKEDHHTVKVPARFSMAFRNTPGGLKIVDHHSSLFPPKDFDPAPYFADLEKS